MCFQQDEKITIFETFQELSVLFSIALKGNNFARDYFRGREIHNSIPLYPAMWEKGSIQLQHSLVIHLEERKY
jgi:hypothetical protein